MALLLKTSNQCGSRRRSEPKVAFARWHFRRLVLEGNAIDKIHINSVGTRRGRGPGVGHKVFKALPKHRLMAAAAAAVGGGGGVSCRFAQSSRTFPPGEMSERALVAVSNALSFKINSMITAHNNGTVYPYASLA